MMAKVYDIISIRLCLEFEPSIKNKNWLKFLGNQFKSVADLKVVLLLRDQNICYGVQKYDLCRMEGRVEAIFRGGRKIFCVYGKNSSLIRNRYV